MDGRSYLPIRFAAEEFLIYGLKYVFPAARLGEYTRGISTGIAAPIFKDKVIIDNSQITVWPYAEGVEQGLALAPIYPSVPKSIAQYPDQASYDLLALIDVIRQGRARERNLAVDLLRERLKD